MVPLKERTDRCASIRKHLLLYAKRNDLSELDKAMAELRILMDLAELAPAPLTAEQAAGFGVIPGLTDAEIAGFMAAIRGEEETMTVTKGDVITIVPEQGPVRRVLVSHVEQHIITLSDLE